MRLEYEYVGDFVMETSDMRVCDPFYGKDGWGTGVIRDCLPGTWHAAISCNVEGRVTRLVARHESTESFRYANGVNLAMYRIRAEKPWRFADFEVGVDTARVGLFDDKYYAKDCCKLSSGEKARAIPFGVVSESGWGDGSYPIAVHPTEDKKIDTIAIIF